MSPKKEAKHYLHYLHKKRSYRSDIMAAEDLQALGEIEAELKEIISTPGPKSKGEGSGKETGPSERLAVLKQRMESVIPPTKSEGWTENVEVVLTAVVLALALKAFFLAPFKIPTGSMQPTLYGITCQALPEEGGVPNPVIRIADSLLFGTSYHRVRVKEAGSIEGIQPGTILGLIEWVQVRVAGHDYFLLCSYDTFLNGLAAMMDVRHVSTGQIEKLRFNEGDFLANFRSKAGDRLLVNRMVYHFTRPEVGQIFVFNTQGIRGIEAENSSRSIDHAQFYIKRCVGIPGNRLSIQPPHLLNHGKVVHPEEYKDDFTAIYSMEDGYNGYVLFQSPYARINDTEDAVYLREDQYFAMGDNSRSSSDSRNWGPLKRRNLVGTGFVVYWPFSTRWGLIQ